MTPQPTHVPEGRISITGALVFGFTKRGISVRKPPLLRKAESFAQPLKVFTLHTRATLSPPVMNNDNSWGKEMEGGDTMSVAGMLQTLQDFERRMRD